MRPSWMAREYDCRGIDAANDWVTVALMAVLFLAGSAMALTGCPSGTFGPPPVDDPVIVFHDGSSNPLASDCDQARDRAKALGCPEALQPTWDEACEKSATSSVSAFSATCAKSAQSRAQIRQCGVRCTP